MPIYIFPKKTGVRHARQNREPRPPTRGFLFDFRTDSQVAAHVAAYDSGYQGELLRQLVHGARLKD
jgi:hypothetical protein